MARRKQVGKRGSPTLPLPKDIERGCITPIAKNGREYYRWQIMIGGKAYASEVSTFEKACDALRRLNLDMKGSSLELFDERLKWRSSKFRDWCEYVMEERKVMRGGKLIEDTTSDLYRWCLTKWVYPFLGDRRLDSINDSDMVKFADIMRKGCEAENLNPLGYHTQRNVRAALSRCLKEAHKRKYINQNWALLLEIQVAKPRPNKRRFVRVEDKLKLLNAFEGHWIYGPLLLGIYTGMRPSEVAGLKVECVCLEGKYPFADVEEQLVRIKGKGLVQKRLKTENSHRSYFLPVIVVKHLKTLKPSSIFLFENDNKQPIDHSQISHILRAKIKKLGIKCADGSQPCFTDLCRKAVATARDRAGISAKKGAEFLGHTEGMHTSTYTQEWREKEDQLKEQKQMMDAMHLDLNAAIRRKQRRVT